MIIGYKKGTGEILFVGQEIDDTISLPDDVQIAKVPDIKVEGLPYLRKVRFETTSVEERSDEETLVEVLNRTIGDLTRLHFPHCRPKIGCTARGGIGDFLMYSAVLAAIRRKFPQCSLTFLAPRSYVEKMTILRGNPYIDKIVYVNAFDPLSLMQSLKKDYDIFFSLQYIPQVFFWNQSDNSVQDYASTVSKALQPYKRLSEKFPRSANAIGCLKKHVLTLINEITLLNADSNDMFVQITDAERAKAADLAGPLPYVTVHNWSDRGAQTKVWFADRWKEVAKYLWHLGFRVIQVGMEEEERIPNTINALGLLTLHETAALIQDASFHLDIEGGLVHIARAVKTPSVVLFGPTPVGTFGYPENINVRVSSCKPCWWLRDNWMFECSVTRSGIAKCMDDIRIEDVKKAVDLMINQTRSRWEENRKKCQCVNLGCGSDLRDGYIQVDKRKLPGVGIVTDVGRLPIKERSIDFILSRHILEHFSHWEVPAVLAEWVRAIKVRGTLAIEVPNMPYLCQVYLERTGKEKHTPEENISTWLDLSSRFFGHQNYPDNQHRSCFSGGEIRQMLARWGLDSCTYLGGYEPVGDETRLGCVAWYSYKAQRYLIEQWQRSNILNGDALYLEMPIDGTGSYSIIGRNLLWEVEGRGITVVNPLRGDSQPEKALDNFFGIVCQADLGRYRCIPTSRRIGYFFWDNSRLPKDSVSALNVCDAIMTPSNFSKQVFENSGVTVPIYVVPLGFNPNLFYPPRELRQYRPGENFIFLFVGIPQARKGCPTIYDAFLEVFSEYPETKLVTKLPKTNIRDVDRWMKSYISYPQLIFIEEDWPDEKMAALYRAAHALVAPSRGEGFYFPGLEALATGLPIIISGTTGEREYVSSEDCFLIGGKSKCSAKEFYGEDAGEWIEPDWEKFKELLLYVRKNYEVCASRALHGSERVRREFTWTQTVDRLLDVLEEMGWQYARCYRISQME